MNFSGLYAPGTMHISIAGPPNRENLVAEISFGPEQWAELNTETGSLTLELYSRRSGEPWTFDYDYAIAALQEARRWLLGEPEE